MAPNVNLYYEFLGGKAPAGGGAQPAAAGGAPAGGDLADLLGEADLDLDFRPDDIQVESS